MKYGFEIWWNEISNNWQTVFIRNLELKQKHDIKSLRKL